MPSRNLISGIFIIVGAFLLGDVVFAAEPGKFSQILGVAYADTRLLVIRILQIIWLFAFVGSLGLLIYGYVLLRRADPEDLYEAPRAKRIMLYGGIASAASLLLFIILTIAYVVIESGYKKEKETKREEEVVPGLGGRMAIPESKIRDHYPMRDERNVSRDTAIIITFAEKIRKESILDSTNAVRRDSILIRRSAQNTKGDYGVIAATGVMSVDGTTLKIIPSSPLGAPDQKVFYTVALTSSILKERGDPLFSTTEGGYSWQFEVSGLIDVTPPTVESYLPLANSSNPINTLIQVTFTEPIDPFTVTSETGVVLSGEQGKQLPLAGSWSVGNGYRTITFISAAACGTNQCGSSMFCLPGKSSVAARVKAAALPAQQSEGDRKNKASFPYTGIVDTAGNSLDGGGLNGTGKNGKSDGAERDDFIWNFSTHDKKETTPPTVLSIAPGRDAQGVSLTAPVVALFSSFMDLSSLNVSSVGFSKEINSWVTSNHVFSDKRTRVQIYHDPFTTNEIYTPVIKSGVTDMYQNCYNPCTGPGTSKP